MKTEEMERTDDKHNDWIEKKPTRFAWLFEYSNIRWLSIIGIIGFFVLILASTLTGTKFTGAFGFKFIEEQSIYNSLIENTIIVLVMTFVFTLLGQKLNKVLSSNQVLNAVLISRLPFILLTFFNINDFTRLVFIINLSKVRYGLYDFIISDVLLLLFFFLSTFILILYSIYLLYRGFSSAVGTIKQNYKFKFFITLVLTELIVKGIFLIL